jgi:hypothetical protein
VAGAQVQAWDDAAILKAMARLASILIALAIPALADTQFRVKHDARVSLVDGECNLRLSVKAESTLTLKGDVLTVSSSGARNEGSQCTAPLPDRETTAFHFEGEEAKLTAPPSSSNNYQAVIQVPSEGHYQLRLTWNSGPPGFSRNNAVRFKTRGRGEVKVGEAHVALNNIEVAMDLGGKILVSFQTEDKRTLSFTGVVNQRRKEHWRADVVCDGPEWHVQGPMLLTVQQAKDRVLAATLEATDGHDRMSLAWTYNGKRVPPIK